MFCIVCFPGTVDHLGQTRVLHFTGKVFYSNLVGLFYTFKTLSNEKKFIQCIHINIDAIVDLCASAAVHKQHFQIPIQSHKTPVSWILKTRIQI